MDLNVADNTAFLFVMFLSGWGFSAIIGLIKVLILSFVSRED